jgi:hypothetical protein
LLSLSVLSEFVHDNLIKNSLNLQQEKFLMIPYKEAGAKAVQQGQVGK